MRRTTMIGALAAAGALAFSGTALGATQTFSTAQDEFTPGTLNQGWWSTNALNPNDANDNYFTGNNGALARDFFTFPVGSVSGCVQRVTLQIVKATGSNNGDVTLGLWDVTTPAATVNHNSTTSQTIYDDLGSGRNYGNFTVDTTTANPSQVLSFPLDPDALADLQNAIGGSGFFTVGGAIPGSPFNKYLFTNSGGFVNHLIVRSTDQPCFSGRSSSASAGVARSFTTAQLTDSSFSQPTGTTLNTYSAVIQWGDGTSSAGQVIVTAPHQISVEGTHTYASPGTYTVTAVINPGQPGSQRAYSTITVS